MAFSVTEPHPTVRPSTYVHSGRGGAGNSFKAPKTTNGATARGPASLFEHGLPFTSSKYSSGRGGAGNIKQSSEKAPFSFDDELERSATRARKEKDGAVWHFGRGGAGNWAHNPPKASRKDSMSSNESSSSGFLGRLSHTFERR